MLARVGISDVADLWSGPCRPGRPGWSSWPGRWPPTRGRCSSTSPRRGSTRRRPKRSPSCSAPWSRDGLAVLLVEHDMSFVMGTCELIYVLDFGQIIAIGAPGEIQSDPGCKRPISARRPWPKRVVVMSPLLELRNIRAGYGTIDVLHGVDLVARSRAGLRPARPERGREVHDPRRLQRPDPALRRAGLAQRQGDQRREQRRPGPRRACAWCRKAGGSSRT